MYDFLTDSGLDRERESGREKERDREREREGEKRDTHSHYADISKNLHSIRIKRFKSPILVQL